LRRRVFLLLAARQASWNKGRPAAQHSVRDPALTIAAGVTSASTGARAARQRQASAGRKRRAVALHQ
jgi:hypothetical protein